MALDSLADRGDLLLCVVFVCSKELLFVFFLIFIHSNCTNLIGLRLVSTSQWAEDDRFIVRFIQEDTLLENTRY